MLVQRAREKVAIDFISSVRDILETTILVVHRVAIGEIYIYVECRPTATGWAF